MFKIGEFARLNKVTVKALRHYEELNILKPESIDKFTGYRYYSASQMPKLNRIIALKDLGFSLSEISSLMQSNLNSEQMSGILKSKKTQILSSIEVEMVRLHRVDSLIRLFEQEVNIMDYDIVIKKVDRLKVASIREIIGDYGDQGHLWQELVEHLDKYNVKIVPPCLVCYHGNNSESAGIDAEICEHIEQDLPGTERIKVYSLPEVEKMATAVHKGPYETLVLAYNALTKWIEENNYKIVGANRELYLKGDWNADSPSDYITEIQFPVESI